MNKIVVPKIKIDKISVLPEKLYILPCHADIWLIHSDADEDTFERLLKTLSHDELIKAERLISTEKRRHFVVSRGILRYLLSRYLNTEPEELEIIYTKNGKPVLTGSDQDKLSYNLSHSHGNIFYGITAGGEIGVDIEKIRSNASIMGIAHRQFTEPELQIVEQTEHEDTLRMFFKIWTRKEAVLKAFGMGLLLPMRNFDVSNVPGNPVQFLEPLPIQDSNEKKTSNWYIFDVNVIENYCTALSVNFIPEIIHIFTISPDDFFRET
ncbi:4'-phosphopantetheinyl transferase family protein [Candidatus Latescibacterota bacterium]